MGPAAVHRAPVATARKLESFIASVFTPPRAQVESAAAAPPAVYDTANRPVLLGAWQPCTSPQALHWLQPGDYTFQVRPSYSLYLAVYLY